MDNSFLPKGYSAPKVEGNYYRFEKGQNRFRIMSSAIVGYEYWTVDKKPVRSRSPFKSVPADAKLDEGVFKPKHFWAFVVWNEEVGRVQILEITQTTIMSAIEALDLSKADLSKADLSWADLRTIKHDVWGVLLMNKNEVPFLRQALIEGKVDGSVYGGECSCLCGTLARGKGLSTGKELPIADADSAAERFFMGIKKGDTPETNNASKIALEWVDEFMTLVSVA